MDRNLDAIDDLLRRAEAIDTSLSTQLLREIREELVRTSVFVSYAIGVLTLDLKILNRCWESPSNEVLDKLVSDMPEMLTTGWVGGGWSLSPDASASVAAAAELANADPIELLALHAELASSDLGDLDVISNLLIRVEAARLALNDRKIRMELRIRVIQKIVQERYLSGETSIDDWLK